MPQVTAEDPSGATVRREMWVEPGPDYRPGDPVRLRVVHRSGRVSVSDDGGAVERAGRPPGWRGAAEAIARELVVNVSRGGAVWLPVVPAGPGEQAIVRRIAEATRALYQELLELDAG